MNRFIILILLIVTVTCSAQEVLTLEQCREMALKQNKKVAAGNKQTAYAHYLVKSIRGNFFPNFTANSMGFYSNTDGGIKIAGGNLPVFVQNTNGQTLPNGSFAYFPGTTIEYNVGFAYSAGISLEQPLYMGGKIRAAYRMALLGEEMASLNKKLTQTDVLQQTDEAYANMVKATALKRVALMYHKLLKELMRNVENAKSQGLSLQNDVLKVQVRLNESELSLHRAENALHLASMNLCHYIGLPMITPIIVTETLPMVPDVSTLCTDISNRPEYTILKKQTEMAKQQVNMTRSEMLPQIGIGGTFSYLNGLKINNEKLFDKATVSLLLNVSVPLYHFGERMNKVKAAKAKLEQTRLEQENLNEQMQLQLMQSVNNFNEARMEVELTERSLSQAEENMRISKNQYDVGMETISDYLEAQLLWQKAYQQHIEAAFNLYLSYVAYCKAAGTLHL